jgi:signal transduction histidine kinase
VVRSSKTAIFLQEAAHATFEPRAFEGIRNLNVSIPSDHVLLQHMRHATGPLVKDELALMIEQEQRAAHLKELKEVYEGLNWLDVSVVVPLFVDKKLTGVILVGDKLSGQPYLQDDVEFLATLAPQAATALENARLYQEAQEFGKRLKLEVERATHELEQANLQLKDLDKAKSEFLSIASHQLYTPLTALRGYISMFTEGDFGAVSKEQKPVLDILEKSATRLIDLIKNLLDISRIESGRLELKLESTDLGVMAKELVQDLMPNAMNKGLKLLYEVPTQALPHVVVDQQRVRQVMLNFIDNSIKYTSAGRVIVSLKQEHQELVFSVSDTGKGLTREEITKLFNKFSRVGGSSRFHTEGTGLGLYVARQIVREHRGDVAVDSPGTGKGSTFSMRLPIEGSMKSLKLTDKASVVIKAAEAQGKAKG